MCRALWQGASSSDGEGDDAAAGASGGGAALDESCYFCFDSFEVDAAAGCVRFAFSHRDARSGVALCRFATRLHVAFPGGVVPPGAKAACLGVGLASLPWLYMGLPTRRVVVRAAPLDDEQRAFWARAYNGTLAEFFQVNGLAFAGGVGVVLECDDAPRPLSPPPQAHDAQSLQPSEPPERAATASRRVLVPMGGGKDSLTVYELLRHADGPPRCAWFFLSDDAGEYDANWRCALQRSAAQRGRSSYQHRR